VNRGILVLSNSSLTIHTKGRCRLKEKRNPLSYLFGKVWEYSEGNRRSVILYWLMFIVANAMVTIAGPLITAMVIDEVQKRGITKSNFAWLILLTVLPIAKDVIFWSLHGPARVLERANAWKIGTKYRKYLVSGVMNLPLGWHTDQHTGSIVDKVEKGSAALSDFAEEGYSPIGSLVELVVSMVTLFLFSKLAGSIILGMILFTIWFVVRFDRVMMTQYDELNRMGNSVSENIVDAIGNITTIIILRIESLVFRAIRHQIEKPWELYRQNIRLNEWKWFGVQMCCTINAVIVTVIYFRQHLGTGPGELAGSVYLLLSYLNRISNLFQRFADNYSGTVKRKSKLANAEELTKYFKQEDRTIQSLPADWREICIKGLNFSYHTVDGADLHLDDVSICFQRGKKVALIGDSGSGKSTLLKLVGGMYPPRDINITVDGSTHLHGLEGQTQITQVPQKPEILTGSILHNITIGAEYDLETVRRYTDLACVSPVIDKLPRRFDSEIKEKGVNLSEGEQQRLALARGLLACQEKSLILLDEPTSSIDPANEIAIYQNIFREFSEAAIVSSVHKMHLLPMFDQIYFFRSGRIIAQGTLPELLAKSAEFQELWAKQQVTTCE
jgi:ATP-binding cassette, subfamily B, bacterial